jgi:tRNA (mo5U34)-methyltransferase
MTPGRDAATIEALRKRVDSLHWYHTIDLGDGVITPGWFDTRSVAPRVPLPKSLEGKNCLDVGTWDGFWAFEMERRGAASVTAIDIVDQTRWDWPPHTRVGAEQPQAVQILEEFKAGDVGFNVAHEALNSRVKRLDLSVYELSPETVGTFDVVFLGSLLLHLRDPIAALAALRTVCSGEAVIADTIDAIPSFLRPRTPTVRLEGWDRPWWWIPNRAGLHRMVESAGFKILEKTPVYIMPLGSSHPRTPFRRSWRKLFRPEGREELIINYRGIPHAAVRAKPLG